MAALQIGNNDDDNVDKDDDDNNDDQVAALQIGINWFIPQHDARSHRGGEHDDDDDEYDEDDDEDDDDCHVDGNIYGQQKIVLKMSSFKYKFIYTFVCSCKCCLNVA